MKKINKAVVLLAGYGTRCLPFTKILPKAMIPILNKPAIAYIVEELEKSGIEEVVFVLAKDCNGKIVKQYFLPNKTYEKYLKSRNKAQGLEQLQKIKTNLKIKYVYNTKSNGGGGALLSAQKHVKNQPFVLLNGDDIFVGEESPIKKMIENYASYQKNVFVVKQVPEEIKGMYGICEGVYKQTYYEITKFVEKPMPGQIDGNLAAIGRYLLESDVFKILKKAKKQNGEIYLTDALIEYISQNRLNALTTTATRIDGGNTLEIAKAGVLLALESQDYSKQMNEFLKSLDKK